MPGSLSCYISFGGKSTDSVRKASTKHVASSILWLGDDVPSRIGEETHERTTMATVNQPKECPKCGDYIFHRIWQRGRKLAWRCVSCHWMSERFTPPQQEIETEQVISVSQFGGLEYTLYDQYGHVMILSRTYDDQDDAIAALKNDLIRHPGSTAVLWPETVIAKGEVFK